MLNESMTTKGMLARMANAMKVGVRRDDQRGVAHICDQILLEAVVR